MKTKAIQAIFLASILTLVWGSATWAAERSRERSSERSQQRVQKQTRRVDKAVRKDVSPRRANRGINTNQRGIQRTYDRRENKQTRRIRKGTRNGEITPRENRRLNKEQRRIDRSYYKGRYGKRFERDSNRHPYWKNRGRHHQRPGVHNHYKHQYYEPYQSEAYSDDAYQFSGGFDGPGWEFAFSTEGSW